MTYDLSHLLHCISSRLIKLNRIKSNQFNSSFFTPASVGLSYPYSDSTINTSRYEPSFTHDKWPNPGLFCIEPFMQCPVFTSLSPRPPHRYFIPSTSWYYATIKTAQWILDNIERKEINVTRKVRIPSINNNIKPNL